MLDINKKNSAEDKNFDEQKKEQLDTNNDLDKQSNLATKREVSKLKHDIEIDLAVKKDVEDIEKNIENNLDKAFEKPKTKRATNPDASASGIAKTTNPHLKGRPIAVQEKAIQIEQDMKNLIANSDKDQAKLVKRLFAKPMKWLMSQEK